jgi:exodeoxyribonuclease VII large subunit
VDAARASVREGRDRLVRTTAGLEALSPLGALGRGYAVPRRDGHVLRGVAEFPPGSRFSLRVADGEVDCRSESATDPDGHD